VLGCDKVSKKDRLEIALRTWGAWAGMIINPPGSREI
jgi:hypothetical protein